MKEPREGDYVTIDHHGRHYAVLLQVFTQHAVLIYATSTRRPEIEKVEVLLVSEAGRRLRLENDTYFYLDNCIPVRFSKILENYRRCPPDLLLQLRKMCEPRLAKLAALRVDEMDLLAMSAARREGGRVLGR